MSFTVKVEADWILLETGIDNLIVEDGSTNLVLETAPAWLDLTPYLLYNAISLRFNTIDFELFDAPAFSLHLRENLVTTDPAWTGGVTAIETSDPTDLIGHERIRVTGTNTKTLPTDTAPFDLSESPTDGTFSYLLEDGTSHYLLEDGTDFASPGGIYRIEGALSYAYRDLQVRQQIDTIGIQATHGQATVYQPGLRPGNLFRLTSTNQGYAASQFQVNQINVTWPAGLPWYLIEFGDTPQTLALWTQLSAPSPVVPVSAPAVSTTGTGTVAIPVGPVIYGSCTAGHALQTIGGGIVTIASVNFTVSAPQGHSQTVQLIGQIDCRAYAWDNFVNTPRRAVRATISGSVYTGAWQETPAGTATTAGARGTYDLSSAPGLSLPDGTYTVSVQIDTQEFNQLEVFSAYAQAAVTVV